MDRKNITPVKKRELSLRTGNGPAQAHWAGTSAGKTLTQGYLWSLHTPPAWARKPASPLNDLDPPSCSPYHPCWIEHALEVSALHYMFISAVANCCSL